MSEERLQELLDLKDEQLGELEIRVAELESDQRMMERRVADVEGGWSLPNTDDTDIPDLPLPRLEIRWYKMYKDQRNWGSFRVVYQLVYKHLLDHIVSIPLGNTIIQGGGNYDEPPWTRRYDGIPDLPYRDGTHMAHDSAHFGLPVYAVTDEDEYIDLTAEMTKNRKHAYAQGIEHQRKP